MKAAGHKAVSSGAVFAVLLLAAAIPVQAGVQNTVHDFTVSRTLPAGANTAAGERPAEKEPVGACDFCHTPHNARPTAGLWNHRLPAVTYKLYESPTLQARPEQPTGSSRLCLSCHDGTLALGDLRVRPRGARAASESLLGEASLGTDLSDDHPISFPYDAGLAARQGQLAVPESFPKEVRLDNSGQLQCTSCHDAHSDKYGNFLVMDNRGSRLCITCHQIPGWPGSAHATSVETYTGNGTNPWPQTSFTTVADNGCESCHRQHAAGHPEWLLLESTASRTCFSCHDGSLAAKDVRRSFNALSSHPVETTESLHQPNEDPLAMRRHVACQDCHDPHSVRSSLQDVTGSSAPAAADTMEVIGSVEGVDAAGARVRQARTEYEVCYKCHGLQEEATVLQAPAFLLTRNDDETNVRLQFSTSNASFHPVEATGRNPNIQGLEAGYTPSTILTCTDCHDSNESETPGGARGPHGSIYEPILAYQYEVTDPSIESYQSYALCYRCHNRATLLSDASGFPHQLHVVQEQASCAACHDAHGSRQSPFLINFLVRGKSGEEVVKPSGSNRLEFDSMGPGKGQCFLTCHGHDHDPSEYGTPASGSAGSRLLPGRRLPAR